MQWWYCTLSFKSQLSLCVLRKLTLHVFEFVVEEDIDSEADCACKGIIGEFSGEQRLQGSE